jgi:hypothetical protein
MADVIYLDARRGRTHCSDCDPGCEHPVTIAVRRDPRTEEVLTPCPACGRAALVTTAPLVRRHAEVGWRAPSRSTPGHVA